MITPFRIDVPEADLDDLRSRLHRTRWPEPEPVGDWSQGTPPAVLREFCEYWAAGYDWRRAEVRLNGFPQYRTEIDAWACIERIAAAWAELMARLGYSRYGAQGGDWGTSITTSLAQRTRPTWGIHLNPPIAAPDPATFDDLTAAERAALEALEHARRWEDGYFIRDELLDTITLYWLTGTATSSARLYWESIAKVQKWFSEATDDTVAVPTGCSLFPAETIQPSRRWAARRYTDIRHWNELDRGGHFAAFEQPELFVAEVRTFFRLVR